MEDTQEAMSSGVLSQINLGDDEVLLKHAFNTINNRVMNGD